MASGQNKVLATQEHIPFGIWKIKKRPPMVMSMKYIITLALFGTLSASGFSQSLITTQVVSDAASTNINIPAGKIMEIVYCSQESSNYLRYTPEGQSGASINLLNGFGKLVGPGTFSVQNSMRVIVTYRLLDNIDSSTTTTPTSAVVIPTDATGPVNVILESSTDLVTWTAANPGTYGASTTKRFFRVRAVNQ